MEKHRIGKFEISAFTIHNDFEIVKKIMGQCAIVRAEMMFNKAYIEYIALCDQFDEIPVYESAPLYEALIHDDGNNQEIEFKRVEDEK